MKKSVKTNDNNQVVTSTINDTEAVINQVLYGEWTISNVNGREVTGDERPYLVFDTTATNPFILKYYANNGCNILNGQVGVTAGGEMRKASEGLSTMRFCPDAPYETGITMALETVHNYAIDRIGSDYVLYLKDAVGKTTMTLVKSNISFLNGAWTVTRLGNETFTTSGDDVPQMVIDIPELKVHGNTGCNVMNGNIFIDPAKANSIQFRDLATSRKACPDMQREQAFLVALEQVESAVPGASDDVAIMKDAMGREVMQLQRLQLK